MIGSAPMATMTTSGASAVTTSGVTSAFRWISTPSSASRFDWWSRKRSTSRLLGARPATSSLPPSCSARSQIETSWPRMRAIRAASMPAGPEPITITRRLSAVGTTSHSSSRPASGLTEQRARSPRPTRSTQALQAMHGRSSLKRPSSTLHRPVRLRDQRAAEQHEIGIAVGHDLRRELRIVEPADRDHRHVHGALDGGRVLDHVPARDEHRRQRHVQRVPGTGGDADRRDAGVLQPAARPRPSRRSSARRACRRRR